MRQIFWKDIPEITYYGKAENWVPIDQRHLRCRIESLGVREDEDRFRITISDELFLGAATTVNHDYSWAFDKNDTQPERVFRHMEPILVTGPLAFVSRYESVYTASWDRYTDFFEYLFHHDMKILVACNYGYSNSSGGIHVLYYLCHLLNTVSQLLCRRDVAYMVNYLEGSPALPTPASWRCPRADDRLLASRHHIVVYHDFVHGNPLRQKHVVRWMLYFELFTNMRHWEPSDLVFWYTDVYRQYSASIEHVNDRYDDGACEPVAQARTTRTMHILGNIDDIIAHILHHPPIDLLKDGKTICFTIRKRGRSTGDRRIARFVESDERLCTNCSGCKWPVLCTCQNMIDGVPVVHNRKDSQQVWRFESPVEPHEVLTIFQKSSVFYMYDPFCFSAVFAGICDCPTLIPAIPETFPEDTDLYSCTPWMRCGIGYGRAHFQKAIQTVCFAQTYNRFLFYRINETNLAIFLDQIRGWLSPDIPEAPHARTDHIDSMFRVSISMRRVPQWISENLPPILGMIPYFSEFFRIHDTPQADICLVGVSAAHDEERPCPSTPVQKIVTMPSIDCSDSAAVDLQSIEQTTDIILSPYILSPMDELVREVAKQFLDRVGIRRSEELPFR